MESVIIEKEAMKLPPHERALLADRLLQTLDNHDILINQIWAEEAEQRLASFRDGKLEALDGQTVIESLRKKMG